MSLIDDAPEGANAPEFTVSELSRGVKRTLEDAFGRVRVRGECGRVTFHRNGHVYLDLKDESAVLAGVVWKSAVKGLAIRPQEGDEVVAEGRITTFAGQSKYQLVIEQLSYAGEGALLAKLERLRQSLAAEGLFDEARKAPIPFLPRVVGVVTSPTGAVIRDILHRLAERFPVHVLVWPVAVQGPGSAEQVADAIRGFDALVPGEGAVPRPDVLIVARGGGSIEDLWGFNEEAVVRAAAACTIPLISAVGHETDTTLIDFAADRRAPTPTAAAEIAVPVRAELVATVAALEARRRRAMRRILDDRRHRLALTARALPRPAELIELRRQRLAGLRLPDPRRLIEAARARLDGPKARLAPGLRAALQRGRMRLVAQAARFAPRLIDQRRRQGAVAIAGLDARLGRAVRLRLERLHERLAGQARMLASLDERSAQARILGRGYAVVRDEDGTVLTRAAQIRAGQALDIGFLDGHVQAVTGSAAPRRRSTTRTGTRVPATQGSLFDAE